MSFGLNRPPLARAFLTSFLIFAMAVGGISFVPTTASAAEAQTPKSKKDKKDKKDKAESQELQAREAFAAGRYQEALDSFAKLYAETLHPTYLRNVGRCYMNMDQPDRALNSFREYLRKAKDLTVAERTEVEGFIEEMEKAQKKKKEDAAAVVTAKPVDPTPPPKPILVAPPPVEPDPIPDAPPFYSKGWFWGVVGGVVVVGVLGGLWAGGVFTKKTCPDGYSCN